MKFRSKILFIVILIIAFFISVSLVFNTFSLMNRGKKEILAYRETALKKVENNLKNYVNIAYTIMETNYNNASEKEKLVQFYGSRLKNHLDIVEAMLDEKNEKVKKGRLSLAQAKQQALETIERIRYNNGKGYVWVISYEKPYPKMILESAFPNYNGIVLDSAKFNNANGSTKNIFVECVSVCDSMGEGYVDYRWQVPNMDKTNGNSHVEDQKFSYVRLYEDWNWIIGTGIYIEDAIKEAAEKIVSDLRTIRYDEGKGYFWINDDTEPTPRLIMNPTWTAGEGKIHTGKNLNVAFGQDWNLYEAFLAKSREGDGFVSYRWKKETKNETKYDVPKQSYVKYFKDLGWVVGSGVYIDDIDAEIEAKTEEMQRVRNKSIVNYLIISFIVAGIAITVLLVFMNKHFKEHSKLENEQKDKNKDDLLHKYSKDITPHVNQVKKQTEKTTKVGGDIADLIKVFVEEQTKLITFAKLVEKTEVAPESIENISEQIQALTNQIKQSADKIAQSFNDQNTK